MVVLEVAEELRPLLYASGRRACVHGVIRGLPADPHASLGHVVQSVGVPLTEVGALRRCDGTALVPSYRPAPDEVVRVMPLSRPQLLVDPRFLLDVHLGALARRLRLLGLDVAYRNDAADDDLVAWARREHRVLLTRDRGLLLRRALPRGAYVRGQLPDEQVRDVLTRFAPPLAPFTRCLSCGAWLRPATREQVLDELAPGTRRTATRFTRCAGCGRVFWRGAHARRLDALVAAATARISAGAGNVAASEVRRREHSRAGR
ncbi:MULTISPECIES: Mut7-C RNAse domain-containing protein [Parafrankia]|uniref:Mut7-C RNAse domain-containing protein n=1 Tax=Parafrankia TaxID=2994362 RepID=UPI001A96A68C|nr:MULTISPECIES: Mut7-C RNAse domain-containing protein [Parafrankia]